MEFLMSTKPLKIIVAALLFSGCAVSQSGQQSGPEIQLNAVKEGVPVSIGATYAVASEVLGTDRRLTVRLPYGYSESENADRTYPVLYLIDGGPEQAFPHIAGIAQLSDTNPAYGEFILVGVETVDRLAEISPPETTQRKYYDDPNMVTGGSEKFRAFLAQEVIPWVNDRYRTSGRDALMGESLAGLFTFETFLREPELFDDYVAVSPSIWWERMEYARRAPEFLSKHGVSDRTLMIYMDDVGYWTNEGTLMVVKTLEEQAPEGLKWAFHDLGDEETHMTIFHHAAFDAIRTLYPVPERIYRTHPSMSGIDPGPRTPEMEARAAEECTLENSPASTPAQTRQPSDDEFYTCVLYDYGDIADRGNR